MDKFLNIDTSNYPTLEGFKIKCIEYGINEYVESNKLKEPNDIFYKMLTSV